MQIGRWGAQGARHIPPRPGGRVRRWEAEEMEGGKLRLLGGAVVIQKGGGGSSMGLLAAWRLAPKGCDRALEGWWVADN
jgi:hypothetical protein